MLITLMPCAMGALRIHIDGFILAAVLLYFILAAPFIVGIGLFYDYRRTMRILILIDEWGRKVLAPRIGL